MKYWLFKSEPDTFSFDKLQSSKKKGEAWDGVRNYQARNYMRDEVKKGDIILFYHSSCAEPVIMGLAQVVKESYPDYTSWEKRSDYFDPKSTPENPRWFMVDIKFKKSFKIPVTLKAIKANPKLKDMLLVQKGQRLSIQPVTQKQFEIINLMAGE